MIIGFDGDGVVIVEGVVLKVRFFVFDCLGYCLVEVGEGMREVVVM